MTSILTNVDQLICPWCGHTFHSELRRRGSVKKWCNQRCRASFFSAARKWASILFERGYLTVETLKGRRDDGQGVHAVGHPGQTDGYRPIPSQSRVR
jgi:hypothetical protein